ncbi:phage tail fiber protein [Acetobacter syzygii]|uniref:Uncharacterized protein n=1 Tax=Acetobacter syzygii TaxID=146476 RepID=A0A270BJH3_9PROT|nr:hypothetical protein [Acetobacter syzygii]NSL91399.1 hypothetical protein [Acetobacter syzygii]PAL24771.1 hypothetical protein B9K05_08735 [Acetobacter syzygii]PAL24885.1 hypothetical protein B9K04_08225 [Acetobacter syzygii]GAN70674.1 hypothetical protein Absy_008_187 [Acetobacter syzygii]GBR65590.1 hypothetical protein AA0483_1922 [Acetobacter syzygii NRIC 0483]
MALDISAANAIFTITVPGLYNAPVTLKNFATDHAWDVGAQHCAQTQMSIDGYLNAGFVPEPVDQTIVLSAASESVLVFEAIMTAQQTARTLYRLGGEITLTSTGRKYTMVNGVLQAMAPMPGAGRMLGDRHFSILWQAIYPAGL